MKVLTGTDYKDVYVLFLPAFSQCEPEVALWESHVSLISLGNPSTAWAVAMTTHPNHSRTSHVLLDLPHTDWTVMLLPPPSGASRSRWETWACLTPLRSITGVNSSPTWRRPWLSWDTTSSASSFTCTGERRLPRHNCSAATVRASLFNASVLLLQHDLGSDKRLKSFPPANALKASHQRALGGYTSAWAATCLSSDSSSVCSV